METCGVKQVVAVNKDSNAPAMSELPGRTRLCIELHFYYSAYLY